MPAAALASSLRPRVLVAEGNAVVAEDLKAELSAAGADVLGPARDLADALDLLATGPAPTAAILDVFFRGETVCPLVDVLRKRGIPFVITTAHDRSLIPDAYAGVPRCEKPYRVEHCLELLFGLTTEER